MANIFVSSTHNDLRDLRGELASFLRDFGTPYLSSEEGFPHVPTLQPCVACLRTLESCSVVIVIIDRRYGGIVANWAPYSYDGLSPLHAEVRHALVLHKHVRVYVRDDVLAAFELFGSSPDIAASKQVIEPKVLTLIQEIKESVPTPWIYKFNDVRDIKADLAQYFKFALDTGLEALRAGTPAGESSPYFSGEILPVSSNNDAELIQVRTLLVDTVSRLEREKPGAFSADDVIRLHLSTSAALSALVNSDLLSAHVMNEVHSLRAEIVPTVSEKRLLLRTLLSDRADHLPGWCWFEKANDELLAALRSIAQRDAFEGVRAMAITYLTVLGRDRELALDLIKEFHTVESEELKRAILELAGESGVGAIDHLAAPTTTYSTLRGAIRRAHARSLSICADPLALPALANLDDDEVVGQEDTLRKDVRAADVSTVRVVALSAKSVVAFEILVNELEIRGEGVEDILQAATAGPTRSVAVHAVALLLGRGISVGFAEIERIGADDPSQRRRLLKLEFELKTDAEVLPEVEFLSLDRGVSAYECLATRYFPTEYVRKDLRNDFADLQHDSVKRHAAAVVAGIVEDLRGTILERVPDGGQVDPDISLTIREAAEAKIGEIAATYSRLYINLFRAAALRSLAMRPSLGDRDVALRFIDETDDEVRSAAIALLSKTGVASDVTKLVEIAQAHTFHDVEAAGAAVALDANQAVYLLLRSESTRLVGYAVTYLIREENTAFEEEILMLLFNPSAAKREIGCAYVIAMWTGVQIGNALAVYQGKSFYFYNVVCWLDRALYAPVPIRQMFRERLTRQTAPSSMRRGMTSMLRKALELLP